MPKTKETAPPGSKRRVTVRRKSAVPEVDPAIAYAIAQAVEAQDIETIREIVLRQEAQMHTLRIIMFDFLIIFREEHYNAKDPVSKKRFAEHIAKIRASLEQNVPELKKHHTDANDIDDLDASAADIHEDDLFSPEVDVAELVRRAADDARAREEEAYIPLIPDIPDDNDLMDEMLERASEEADEWTEVTPRPHPRSRIPRRGGPRRSGPRR